MKNRSIVAMVVLALFFLGCGGGSPSSPSATPRPIWSNSGTGDMVFDMPRDVARVHVVATYTGYSSNFIVWIDNTRLLVNELLGTGWDKTTYDGTLLTGGGGVVSITGSAGVIWSFTEVR